MGKIKIFLCLTLLLLVTLALTGCPQRVHEKVKEKAKIGAFEEAIHARDLAIKKAIESNILSDPVLEWYAKTYGGLTVEVSHAVATVKMKVKTQALHDQALELARQAKDVRDIIDEIEVDPNLEDPPFEW